MLLAKPIPFAGLIAPEEDAGKARLALLGVPDASQSSYRDDCAAAPAAIRAAYDGACFNPASETGVELAGRVADVGDVAPEPDVPFAVNAARYQAAVEAELRRGRVPFAMGGDHAITPSLVRAFAGFGTIHFVQWDAHPDMHPDFDGNPDSHACVAARVLEMEHAATVTQIGIRTETSLQRGVRDAHGDRARTITAREAERRRRAGEGFLGHLPDGAAVYLSVDMDGFDPAFAPGVAHPVPGGLSARAGIDLVHEIGERGLRLAGMDVVEACPGWEKSERTLILAGRMLHEGMAVASLV